MKTLESMVELLQDVNPEPVLEAADALSLLGNSYISDLLIRLAKVSEMDLHIVDQVETMQEAINTLKRAKQEADVKLMTMEKFVDEVAIFLQTMEGDR